MVITRWQAPNLPDSNTLSRRTGNASWWNPQLPEDELPAHILNWDAAFQNRK